MKEDRTQFRVIEGIVENDRFTVTFEQTYDEDRDAANAFNELAVMHSMTHFARYNTYKIFSTLCRSDSGLLVKSYQYILRVNLDVNNNNNMLLLVEVQQ